MIPTNAVNCLQVYLQVKVKILVYTDTFIFFSSKFSRAAPQENIPLKLEKQGTGGWFSLS